MTVLELKELLHDYPDNYEIGYREMEKGYFLDIEEIKIEPEDFFDKNSKKVVVVI